MPKCALPHHVLCFFQVLQSDIMCVGSVGVLLCLLEMAFSLDMSFLFYNIVEEENEKREMREKYDEIDNDLTKRTRGFQEYVED